MLTRNSRIVSRIAAYVTANIGFLVLQRNFGWSIAFAVAAMVSAARMLGRADASKDVEDINGLSK